MTSNDSKLPALSGRQARATGIEPATTGSTVRCFSRHMGVASRRSPTNGSLLVAQEKGRVLTAWNRVFCTRRTDGGTYSVRFIREMPFDPRPSPQAGSPCRL